MLMPGEWVEVLSAEDVSRTLDANGCLDALPFMPEMAAFCGRRFKVQVRAERTCVVPYESSHRELKDTVVLQSLRCDGGLHGGCQLGCMMYWKEAWLRRVTGPAPERPGEPSAPRVEFRTHRDGNGTAYQCQGTELVRASRPGPAAHDPRQYLRMLRVKTISVGEFSAIFAAALARRVARVLRRPRPEAPARPAAPPIAPLELKPGELVRVKAREQIIATLDGNGKHRGLAFSEPMFAYAGRTMRVAACVQRIIDERTGKLREFAPGTVLLEGAICDRYRGCARNMPIMWRDAWLERVDPRGADSRGGALDGAPATHGRGEGRLQAADRLEPAGPEHVG